MVISYNGVQSFKVQFGDTVLAFDPISKESRLVGGQTKLRASNFGADIALISLNHPDMNGIDQVNRGDKQAFIINGPGEYEIQGIFIKGLPSISNYDLPMKADGKKRINTIYTINLENMNLCFLGALNNTELSKETKSGIDGIDILFVPISGNGVLSASEAYKFAVSLEPSIIIPMNFNEDSLKAFIKEGGDEEVQRTDKLTIKKKDLESKEGEIIVLSQQ
ncbi:MAG: MBL fold metallo-hydrolase [Candidatus Zambryskibacteria bacterium]|nr:MBL fold metallo-hydrolase [Candidatus Zambryskibacteria bacterium]